MKWCTY